MHSSVLVVLSPRPARPWWRPSLLARPPANSTPWAERYSDATGLAQHPGSPTDFRDSINDEAAHGIPSLKRQLRNGDLVNLDVSAELDGYFSDTGISVAVGEVSPVASRLLEATEHAQRDAMHAAQPGARLRDLGRAVQRRARSHGFRVIKNLNGHGIGRGLHEAPSVPSIDDGQKMVLREGLVLAVEPFLSISADHVVDDADGWTLRTADGSLVAQFEHSMVVTKDGPLVLTA
jgi:methionyl aminopeptidase